MYGETVPDPVEIGEAAAERFADEHVDGDIFRCADCGSAALLSEACQDSSDPYGAPICYDCCWG